LRAQGRSDEAQEVEHGEFARALAVARVSAPDQTDEEALLACEDERVANAAVLAELLAPMLTRHLAAMAPPVSPLGPAEPEAATKSAPVAAGSDRAGAADVPPIADLIEGMLSQERARPRGRR
jgi:hypothetical protein